MNGTNDQVGTALAEQMVSDLNSIGYKASTQLLTAAAQYPFVQNSANSSKWNVAWSAWYQDYPAPSDFLNVLLGCGSIHQEQRRQPQHRRVLRSEPSRRRSTRPSRRRPPTRARASALWTQIDHEDTVQAPWVDLYNPKQIDFLSKDVHGYEWNPQWYILIDQLWLSK